MFALFAVWILPKDYEIYVTDLMIMYIDLIDIKNCYTPVSIYSMKVDTLIDEMIWLRHSDNH